MDLCHVGVVLRAVLFVQTCVALGLAFAHNSFTAWLLGVGMASVAALPGTLLWLVLACWLHKRLAHLGVRAQAACMMGLGALSGLYGAGMLAMTGLLEAVPWLPSAFCGAAMAGAVMLAWAWRARATAPAATQARLDELQSRIRPHFLFNTLNSAIALVRDDPKKAEAVLEDLSELFRSALAAPERVVSLGEELELARRYLQIEQVRFGDRMRVTWALDEATFAARVPPLLLQPLVENAVKHGVETTVSVVDVKVSTSLRGQDVVLRVTNTTAPDTATRHGQGIALANVRERLALLHDVKASLTTAEKDGLFQARIQLPLGT